MINEKTAVVSLMEGDRSGFRKCFSSGRSVMFATCLWIALLGQSCDSDSTSSRYRAGGAPKLNAVILVSDALRRDVLGFVGGPAATPNIDWLAANGVVFQAAYSSGSSTVPSSVGMFTGNYQHSYPLTMTTKGDDPYEAFLVSDSEILLAEILADLGYTVAKSVENPNAEVSNNLQGFTNLPDYGDLSSPECDRVVEEFPIVETDRRFRKMFGILSYLLTSARREPFLLLEWILDPHEEYDPPEGFPPLDEVGTRLPRDPNEYRRWHTRQLDEHWRDLSADERTHLWNLYVAEVESVDARVGLVLEALRRSEVLDRTFVIFTSDHGEMFGEHGFRGHRRRFFEELVHVPMIIMGPGLNAGALVRENFSHVSLMPTLASLLGVHLEGDLQGHSYVSAMHGRPFDQPEYLYLADKSLNASGGLVAGMNKLHVYGRKGEQVHVFDLHSDPFEDKDLGPRDPSFEELNQYFLRARAENESRRRRREREASGSPERPPPSEETIEQLRALGYIE